MRSITIFTVNPFDVKNFDYILLIRKLDNGHWEVGVYIDDVFLIISERIVC
ncbi:MAG: hypothetical protein ACMUEM_03315 [Flavobacteriales bacterium AspAUS03]